MKKKTRYVNVRFKTGFKVIINNIPFNPYVIRNFSRDSYSKNASNCAFCSRLGITIRSKYHFIYTKWKCDRIKNGVKVPGVNEGDGARGGGGGGEKKKCFPILLCKLCIKKRRTTAYENDEVVKTDVQLQSVFYEN